jgi:hypothetical protein
MRSIDLPLALALPVLLLGGVGAARAQDRAAQPGVRVVSVRAAAVTGDQPPPPIPQPLAPWADVLRSIPDLKASFTRLGQGVARGAPGAPLTFHLAHEHDAVVTVTRRDDGKLAVRVVITRPARDPKHPGKREQVLAHEVVAEDGASWVVRVGDVFGKDDHLLLIITAATGPLE